MPSRQRGRQRGRRLVGAGLAACVAVGSLALAPTASADEEPSEGSDGSGELTRPFGDEIEPGTSFGDAPEVTTGTYAVDVPEVGADHFFEINRTEPGEVLWFGVMAQFDEPVGDRGLLSFEGVADGDSTRTCSSSGTIFQDEARTTVTRLLSSNRERECRDAESIVIRVANTELGDEALPEGGVYQLVIWTEPPLERSDRLPGANENSPWTPLTSASGEPTEVEGATTFTEAEALADGSYSTVVRKGQPAIFGFPLTFGQHAQVQANIAAGGESDSFESLEPVWVSPIGGRLRDVNPGGGPGPALALSGEDPAGWATPIVTYLNRQRAGGVGALSGGGSISEAAAPAAFSGTYYLVLELPDGEFSSENFPDELPITMDVATITDYEGRPPDYASEPAALSALDGSGYVETAEEEQQAQEAAAEPAPWLLVAGLFVGAALLAAVGGVAVGRAMRSRA